MVILVKCDRWLWQDVLKGLSHATVLYCTLGVVAAEPQIETEINTREHISCDWSIATAVYIV